MLRNILHVAALLFFVVALVFSVLYLTTDYVTLKNWYLSLNSCLYRRETWANDFFTAAVKSEGNRLTIVATILATAGIIYVAGRWRRVQAQKPLVRHNLILLSGWKWNAAVIGLAVLLGLSSWGLAMPSNDEVFSAVNCAELPGFQTITYYMLPNNHIYFNFINHLLFGWFHDPIPTGRLISFFAYVATLLVVFHCLRQFIQTPAIAFLVLLPVALQFHAWGFATQARGYECLLLCSWVSVGAMVKYIRTESLAALRTNAVFNILAFAVMPTYAYLFGAQVIFFMAVMMYKRNIQWTYIKYLLLTSISVFMLYLPAFCFSGVKAFTQNTYVTPHFGDCLSYLPGFRDFILAMINNFSSLPGEYNPVNYILFCVPVLLFFSKRRMDKAIATFYIILWMAFVSMALRMRCNPFIRNMIMHYSITMACAAYTLYVFINFVSARIPVKRMRYGFILLTGFIPFLGYCSYQLITDRRNVSSNLYFNVVNVIYSLHKSEIEQIPAGSSIGFSDEGFYFFYYCRKWGYKVNKCANGNEEYYAKRLPEELPGKMKGNYTRFKVFSEGYEIWKRNQVFK